ncbi:MAG: HAMP domain-containing sensor histidine kinase [Bacteroidota bacterium]
MKKFVISTYTRTKTMSGVVLVVWVTVCSLYTLLYWFIPFTSFSTGFLLASVISLITAYPVGWIILSYASKMKSQSQMAKEDNKVKDKLINILGHDLKGPLNNIKQTLVLLNDGHINRDEFDHLSKNLTKDVDSTLNLTSNLVKWINVQQKDFRPEILRVNIAELIKECITLYDPIALEKNIELDYYSPINLEMDTDPEMIKIVLRNLIGNAIKFSHAHNKIDIDHDISGTEVTFSIADYGIGMSPQDAKALFSLNEVKSQVGTNQEKGTGLGMNLCKTVVNKLEGRIWVDAKLGEGTTFHFTVPSPYIKVLSKKPNLEPSIN